MKYNGTVYRPPIEANTLLLPVTEGCSHNSCTFCNMYQGIPFRMLSLEEVEEYLGAIREEYDSFVGRVQRIYLVGADPFALSASRLLERISLIRKYLPNIKVITMYARVDNIAHKSDADLVALKEAGVNDLYIGVECGLDDVLESLNKGYGTEDIRREVARLNAIGIRHSDLLMLGTAGKGRGAESAKAMADLENELRPDKILINTMSAFVGTPLDHDIREGKFTPATEREHLEEERDFLAALNLPDTYFWSLHPLDSVRIDGILREEKEDMLKTLAYAIDHADNFNIKRISRTGNL
ncbi:MAG: radical SAM protein [Anaerovibrio sp.]|nr:radical SAM protein [Anaerovibrio sp.]